MDRKPTEQARIQELILRSHHARQTISRDVHALKRKLDLPLRIRDSLRHHPATWLVGSLTAGLTTSFLFRRKPRREAPPRSTTRKLLGLTLTAARPLVKVWLGKQLQQWATTAIQRSQNPGSPFKNNPEQSRPHVRPPGS